MDSNGEILPRSSIDLIQLNQWHQWPAASLSSHCCRQVIALHAEAVGKKTSHRWACNDRHVSGGAHDRKTWCVNHLTMLVNLYKAERFWKDLVHLMSVPSSQFSWKSTETPPVAGHRFFLQVGNCLRAENLLETMENPRRLDWKQQSRSSIRMEELPGKLDSSGLMTCNLRAAWPSPFLQGFSWVFPARRGFGSMK